MQSRPQHKMTVDEFLAWAEENPGRYELDNGDVFGMSPERLGHAITKFAMQTALFRAIRKAGIPCHMVPDGAAVRINEKSAYEPDALVYCGPEWPSSQLEVPNPVIIVEVLSPSTKYLDIGGKLTGYFTVPSVFHYLIVDTEKRLVIHHARGEGEMIMTRIVRDGTIAMTPPGIVIALEDCFQA